MPGRVGYGFFYYLRYPLVHPRAAAEKSDELAEMRAQMAAMQKKLDELGK